MNRSLVIYFSRIGENIYDGSIKVIEKGNTEVIAEYIKEFTGADLFKVERKDDYASDYNTCMRESKEEFNSNARPELKNYLDSIDEYDTIYIGSPIYWGTMPNPMFTQLERLNWHGKNVRVFTTHEGNGLGKVLEDVKRVCYGANVNDNAIAILGHEVNDAKNQINTWINS